MGSPSDEHALVHDLLADLFDLVEQLRIERERWKRLRELGRRSAAGGSSGARKSETREARTSRRWRWRCCRARGSGGHGCRCRDCRCAVAGVDSRGAVAVAGAQRDVPEAASGTADSEWDFAERWDRAGCSHARTARQPRARTKTKQLHGKSPRGSDGRTAATFTAARSGTGCRRSSSRSNREGPVVHRVFDAFADDGIVALGARRSARCRVAAMTRWTCTLTFDSVPPPRSQHVRFTPADAAGRRVESPLR